MQRTQVHDLSQSELEALAERLGGLLRGGETLLLEGEMGSGKTTFTRALARGLGLDDPARVCSPSYTVCVVHEGPVPLVHVDLFRLGDPDMTPDRSAAASRRGAAAAFESLGIEHEELVHGVGGTGEERGRVLVVEWSSLWDNPPAEQLEIRLSRPALAPDRRDLVVKAGGDASPRLLDKWLGSGRKMD